MSSGSSLKRDAGMADERTVRSFLEQAAPIILESQVLDGERFDSVCRLADDFGLTRDQLACELRLLEQRGVITSAPWEQLGEAPDGSGAGESEAESGSEAAHASGAAESSEQRHSRAASGGPPAAAAPSDTPSPPTSVDISTASPAINALRDRALKILSRRGTLSAKMRRKLQKAGKAAGLSESQISSVLDTLPDQVPGDAPPLHNSMAAGETAPPSNRSPSETFRRWIDQKLSGYPSSILTMDDESGLVGVGTHRYHLASVLATHLVRDIATERGIRLERDLDSASCNSTVASGGQASADDHKLEQFFEQVAPILAQHRGITPRSRVMMNAVAQRLGLTQPELERALATLQRRSGDPDENDPRQLERRESFRAYLRRAMAHLPNGIVTFKTEQRLCQAGEHFHGVALKWIKPTIKEVASEIGACFISRDKAIEHVKTLAESRLDNSPILDATTRSRIYTEGTQWGLDPMDIDAILRERTQALRQQLAAERRRSRWVINFVIGGLAVVSTILTLMFLLQPGVNSPPDKDKSPESAKKEPSGQRHAGLPWWNDKLRIAAARLRIMRPDLRPLLDEAASEQERVRGRAYGELVSRVTEKLPDRQQEETVSQLFVLLHALEPSDVAAGELRSSLLRVFETLNEGFPQKYEPIEAMFWGCQVAVAMLKHPETSADRRGELREQLDAATFATGDPLLEADALQRLYAGAVVKHLYQLLIRLAAEDAARAEKLFGSVHFLAENWLDSPVRDQLLVEFLEIILPVLEDKWGHFGGAIRQAAQSSDPNTVIKLLNIYRRTTNGDLRNYLASLFLDRLGAASGSLTEAEMIEGIRESLGIAAKERDYRRWTSVARTAEELLGRGDAEVTGPEQLLQETVELAHVATLACALSRGESGEPVFETMRKEGPVKVGLSGKRSASAALARYESPYPVSERTVLKEEIRRLSGANTAIQRIHLIRMIARETGSVDDIDLRSGQMLAEYMVQVKSDQEEHREMLRYAEQLGGWNAVRLGLADQLLEMNGRGSQAAELFSKVMGGDVNLTTRADRDEIRRRLLSQVVGALSKVRNIGVSRYRVFDEGSQTLLDLYARQARLLSVPSESYTSAGQPSSVVAALVNHVAERLDDGSLEPVDQAVVDSIPHRLKAIDFVAENDLQRTAGLQRLWLELLAIHMTRQHPETSAAVREIRDSSHSVADEPERVFEQLRDIQANLLRMWMQLRPSFDGIAVEELETAKVDY